MSIKAALYSLSFSILFLLQPNAHASQLQLQWNVLHVPDPNTLPDWHPPIDEQMRLGAPRRPLTDFEIDQEIDGWKRKEFFLAYLVSWSAGWELYSRPFFLRSHRTKKVPQILYFMCTSTKPKVAFLDDLLTQSAHEDNTIDVNQPLINTDPATMFQLIVIHDDLNEYAPILIQHGGRMSCKNRNGETFMHYFLKTYIQNHMSIKNPMEFVRKMRAAYAKNNLEDLFDKEISEVNWFKEKRWLKQKNTNRQSIHDLVRKHRVNPKRQHNLDTMHIFIKELSQMCFASTNYRAKTCIHALRKTVLPPDIIIRIAEFVNLGGDETFCALNALECLKNGAHVRQALRAKTNGAPRTRGCVIL